MIYQQKVEFANTLYSKYPLKNAGGDQQLTLRSISSSSGMDITRIILAPPSTNSKYKNYKNIGLILYPSYADLQTSEEFNICFHSIYQYQGVMWSPGFSLESYDSTHKMEGSSWKYNNTQIQWEQQGGNCGDNVYTYSCSYRIVYDYIEFKTKEIQKLASGILLKYQNQDKNVGYIRFYSPNTHTIFYPRYVYYVDDYSWEGSKYQITNVEDYIITIPDIKFSYAQQSIQTFFLNLTPKLYSRDWTTSIWKLKDTSYIITSSAIATYCVYDVTNIEKFKVFDHDQTYTRISCDGQRNYFVLDMSQFPKNRFYQLQLKINNEIHPIEGKFTIV